MTPKMRDNKEERNSGRGDEEIASNKMWEYEEGEVMIWRRCADIRNWKLTKTKLVFIKIQ